MQISNPPLDNLKIIQQILKLQEKTFFELVVSSNSRN